MPAAAVIPAPLVYINIVVVKTLVVGGSSRLPAGGRRARSPARGGARGGWRRACGDWNGGARDPSRV